MNETIRFYTDQHFPGPASRGLRRHGIDTLSAAEANRCSLTDVEQLTFATSQDRVMVTFDSDF